MSLTPRGVIQSLAAFDSAARHKPAIHISVADEQHLIILNHHYTHAQRERTKEEAIDSIRQINQPHHLTVAENGMRLVEFFQSFDFFLRKFDVQRGDGLIQVFHFARANDRRGDVRFV